MGYLSMPMTQTKVVREPEDVDRRLSELGLLRAVLLEVRDVAMTSASNATNFHPSNAAGTFAYQDGSWALRDRHVKTGGEWELDRTDSIETIKNEKRKLKVGYQNVDIACDDDQKPKPRSKKGVGSERACSGNLFGDLPSFYTPVSHGDFSVFYLMVDSNGAVELTQPVVKGRTFSGYVERIYLSDGGDMLIDKSKLGTDDRIDDFDPLVARK
jgi:hypothetical protein